MNDLHIGELSVNVLQLLAIHVRFFLTVTFKPEEFYYFSRCSQCLFNKEISHLRAFVTVILTGFRYSGVPKSEQNIKYILENICIVM